MATNEDKLRRRIRSQVKQLGSSTTLIERDVNRLFKGYISELKSYVSAGGRSKTATINAREAIKMGEQMSELLADSGMEETVNNFLDQFRPLTRTALDYFKEFPEYDPTRPLGGVDSTQLDAWINHSEQRLRQVVDQRLVAPLQDSFLQSAFGNLPRRQIVDEIVLRGTYLSPAQVTVEVERQFADYQRQVTVLKAEDVFGKEPIFQYLGPDDSITSFQCQELLHVTAHDVPGMLYKSEISLDQLGRFINPRAVNLMRRTGSPLIHGGHPRCRHKYVPVSPSYAQELGFKA